MQVGAISASNICFKASDKERQFANLSDNAIRRIAWNKASEDVNDKKHHKIDNGIYYTLPLIGGVSSLARPMNYEPIKGGEFNLNGIKYSIKQGMINVNPAKLRSAKLKRAGIVTALWATALGASDILLRSFGAVEKKAKPVKDFVQEHPIITTAAAVGATIGTVYGISKLGNKLVSKYVLKEPVQAITDFFKVSKLDKVLNENKVLNTAEKIINKMPPVAKDIGAKVVEFMPWIAIGTQFAHSFGHEKAKLYQANKNYQEIKTAQQTIREDIINEEIEKELDEKLS